MTAELEGRDPAQSVLGFFGAELRRMRMKAGWSQAALAARLYCTDSLLSKIEAAKRMPSEELAQRCDEVFETDGHFARLWPLVISYAYPAWFRPFIELEEQASAIRSFQHSLIPGLLQTEEYARAVLAGGRPENLDALVFARIHRQRILTRPEPPRLWVVLDERALRRRIGGPAVMRAQLARLLQAMETPRFVVQVIRSDVEVHPAHSAFASLVFDEGPDVLYVEGFYEGQLRGEPEAVAMAQHVYDLLKSVALSPEASADLISIVMKELPT